MFSAFVTTAEVERGKGFPDVYLEAAKRLGLEPGECIVYEDIYQGIRAAKGAGFHTAACLNEHYQDDDKMRAESEYIFRQACTPAPNSPTHRGMCIKIISPLPSPEGRGVLAARLCLWRNTQQS